MNGRIAVIGTGYVGLVTGTCFADLGNHVVCMDIDEGKVERLKQGKSPIYEPGLEEMLQRNLRAGRLEFTTSYEDALQQAEFVFIAVGTPESPNGSADMRYVASAAKSIGQIAPGRAVEPLRIINKSTVPIGSGDQVSEWVGSVSRPDFKFAVVSNPEFLREGQAVFDFLHPDRIILGSEERAAAESVKELYEALDTPVMITDLRTAEMIKYASNAILATYISFANEIAFICEELGADVKEVVQGMGYDKRINAQFLNAGVGFGGSCFPKDVKALAHMAENGNARPQLLHAVLEINLEARRRFVAKVIKLLGGEVAGKRIGVLGLSFKPDTDDMRESPSIDIVEALIEKGAEVAAYDPIAMEAARKELPEAVHYCRDAYEVARGADALLLITAWNEFKQLDMEKVRDLMRNCVLVDGRNVYDPKEISDLGFTYVGVGRPPKDGRTSA
ncbi:MAG TPA: UDP-glucose/GDP-mannose dehydrogenase family protein [Chloroflexia bacterium]|nr:UDP-glucose/GDP-mannose dehydrogenase family protein [Chloroflexia bacterium]